LGTPGDVAEDAEKQFVQNLKKQLVHDDDDIEEIEDDSASGTPSAGKCKRATVNVFVPPDDCVLE